MRRRSMQAGTEAERLALMVVPLLIAVLVVTLIYSLFSDDEHLSNPSRDVPQSPGNYAAER